MFGVVNVYYFKYVHDNTQIHIAQAQADTQGWNIVFGLAVYSHKDMLSPPVKTDFHIRRNVTIIIVCVYLKLPLNTFSIRIYMNAGNAKNLVCIFQVNGIFKMTMNNIRCLCVQDIYIYMLRYSKQ